MVNADDYKSGFVLFSMSMESKDDIKYAREYCDENNLTPDKVSIKIRTIKNEKNNKEEQFLLVIVK